MILAADVHYTGDRARAAGVLFSDWADAKPADVATVAIDEVKSYRPGAFFERELPCLLALLDAVGEKPGTIVIDGYVTLGTEEHDGLGMHLYRALDERVPVLGVAKTRFRDTPDETEIVRGRGRMPLYVTSVGIEHDAAKRLIRSMHGPYRVPTLLKLADKLSRQSQSE